MTGMSELLNTEEVDQGLANLAEWWRDGDSIVRTVELASFPEAIQVVNRIAEIAENLNHHPDIDIRWRTLYFRCSTHYKGGITQADLNLARDIDTVIDAVAD